MTDTLKLLIGSGKDNLKIRNKNFSGEVLSFTRITACGFIAIVFTRWKIDKLNFKSMAFCNCNFNV